MNDDVLQKVVQCPRCQEPFDVLEMCVYRCLAKVAIHGNDSSIDQSSLTLHRYPTRPTTTTSHDSHHPYHQQNQKIRKGGPGRWSWLPVTAARATAIRRTNCLQFLTSHWQPRE